MRRTTLTLDDQVFAALRQRAATQGRSLKDVLNDTLRQALAPRRRERYRFAWRPERGRGLQPGVNLDDRDALWDLMEGRH